MTRITRRRRSDLTTTSRFHRRTLVAALVLGYVTSFLGPQVLVRIEAVPIGAAGVVGILGILVTGAAGLTLASSSFQRLSGASSRYLDEREQAMRNQAYRVSYRILATAVWLTVVYVYVRRVADWPWLLAVEEDRGLLLWGVPWLVGLLPSAVLAWTEPEAAEELA